MSRNRHWRAISRGKPRLKTQKRILIVTEGAVTEPVYFRDLGRRVRTQVEIIVTGAGAVPVTVVDLAVRMKKQSKREGKQFQDDFLAYDDVWCVFDVDEHKNLGQALQRARANEINVALSNPSFELWILLHFQEQRPHIERSALRGLCRNHIPNYDKTPPCEKLYPRLDEAITRATNLERWQTKSGRPRGNPSTSVHKLILLIRKLAEDSVMSQLQKHRQG